MNTPSGREGATPLDDALNLPLSTSVREALAGHSHKARKMSRPSTTPHLTDKETEAREEPTFPVDGSTVSRHWARWWIGAGFPCS